jgi:hypothetical protein
MKKMALFVFNGDPMCFIHVLLNALDMKEKGYETKIIIEGAATKLVPELAKEDNPLNKLWQIWLTGSARPVPTRWAR